MAQNFGRVMDVLHLFASLSFLALSEKLLFMTLHNPENPYVSVRVPVKF